MFKNGFPYEKCSINSHAFILRTNDKITQNFLYFWLDQNFIKERIIRAGMRAAQPGINQVNVNELIILIPENNIVTKFEKIISNSIDKIFANSKQNQKLSELRDWLLPMLMNGQVTVGEVAKEKESFGLVAEGGVKYEKR
jgi:type I restriction enzyme S subunit